MNTNIPPGIPSAPPSHKIANDLTKKGDVQDGESTEDSKQTEGDKKADNKENVAGNQGKKDEEKKGGTDKKTGTKGKKPDGKEAEESDTQQVDEDIEQDIDDDDDDDEEDSVSGKTTDKSKKGKGTNKSKKKVIAGTKLTAASVIIVSNKNKNNSGKYDGDQSKHDLSKPSQEGINVDYSKMNSAEIKKEVAKILEDPANKSLISRILSMFLAIEQTEFSQQLDDMEYHKDQTVASLHKQADKEKDIGETQFVTGMIVGSLTIAAGSFGVVSSSGGIAKTKGAQKSFNKYSKKAERDMKEIDDRIKTGNKEIKETETKLNKLSKDSLKDREDLETRLDNTKTELKKQETSKTKIQSQMQTAKETRDAVLNEQHSIAARNQAVMQLFEGSKSFAEAASNRKIALDRAALKLEEAQQAQEQFLKDNARMFMQKSSEFINNMWGTANTVINSYYQARKAIISG